MEAIKTALQRRDDIARILKEVSGRDVPEAWSPFDAICQCCGRTNTTQVTGLLTREGDGGLRVPVRLPGHGLHARRRQAGLAGGLAGPLAHLQGYRRALRQGPRHGRRLLRHRQEDQRGDLRLSCPFPMVYEWIHLKGVGAMHSSTGIVVTIQEMLDVVPPEVLRYLIIRNKPEKHIEFDPALPLLSLVDEYDQRKGDARAMELSSIGQERALRDSLPAHGHGSADRSRRRRTGLFMALKRSGYDIITGARRSWAGRAMCRRGWTSMPRLTSSSRCKRRFPLQSRTSRNRSAGMGILAERLEGKTAAEIHDLVYAVAKEQALDSKKFFQAIYLAFLGDRQGPKVGWFLASLDRDFVKKQADGGIQSRMTAKIYLAGPLFSQAERAWACKLKALVEASFSQVQVLWPHEFPAEAGEDLPGQLT